MDNSIATLGMHILRVVGIAASAEVARIAALWIVAEVHDDLSVYAVRLSHRKTQTMRQRRVAVLSEVSVATLVLAVRPYVAGIITAAGVNALKECLLKVA